MSKFDEISNSDDILDARDIIERIEYLESEKDTALEDVPESEYGNRENEKWVAWEDSDEFTELNNLSKFMNEFKNYGGDEQWRGDWYPITFIRDSYFTDYTEELIIDCGYISKDFPAWISIDWEETAKAVQQDYYSAELDGVTYWAR